MKRFEYTTVELRDRDSAALLSQFEATRSQHVEQGWRALWCDMQAEQVFMVMRREVKEVTA